MRKSENKNKNKNKIKIKIKIKIITSSIRTTTLAIIYHYKIYINLII
jgi:hypothetical protein